jgi:glyoxylase-like metal-dependent hydrolase (beta-lactamase superfamily II)
MPDHFTLDEIAPGVFAAIATATGAAISNAAIIDLGDKAIVFDAFQTAAAASELRDAVAEATGKSAYLLVNSHWHSDHTGGNQVFEDLPIVGTARMVELIAEDTPDDLDAWAAEIDGYLDTFRTRLDSDDASERALAERRVASLQHIRDGIPGFRLALPDLQIGGAMVIEGERRVELLVAPEVAHTESDIYAWVPDTKTVVAGDLVWNRLHPRIRDGNPRTWADSVEAISLMEPEHVVPGHGRPAEGAFAAEMARYLRGVADVIAEVRNGADPDSVRLPQGSEEWGDESRFRQGVRLLGTGD